MVVKEASCYFPILHVDEVHTGFKVMDGIIVPEKTGQPLSTLLTALRCVNKGLCGNKRRDYEMREVSLLIIWQAYFWPDG
ncbi:hypothetical protein AL01_06700 [Bombella intestini]|uniref:Uncharacterized protein n=1 Tax=Bombella intestini TaxID=1539051 RepID=A0A1S8GQI3_9PROT|nr:hypothetical protein AL01_06700 [Bombella intestini]